VSTLFETVNQFIIEQKLVPGALTNVSVAADGTVWGIGLSNDIYRWNGANWYESFFLLFFLNSILIQHFFRK